MVIGFKFLTVLSILWRTCKDFLTSILSQQRYLMFIMLSITLCRHCRKNEDMIRIICIGFIEKPLIFVQLK